MAFVRICEAICLSRLNNEFLNVDCCIGTRRCPCCNTCDSRFHRFSPGHASSTCSLKRSGVSFPTARPCVANASRGPRALPEPFFFDVGWTERPAVPLVHPKCSSWPRLGTVPRIAMNPLAVLRWLAQTPTEGQVNTPRSRRQPPPLQVDSHFQGVGRLQLVPAPI